MNSINNLGSTIFFNKMNQRSQVVFDKTTINNQFIWDLHTVSKVEGQVVEVDDGDGFTDLKKDGTPKAKICVVLKA